MDYALVSRLLAKRAKAHKAVDGQRDVGTEFFFFFSFFFFPLRDGC